MERIIVDTYVIDWQPQIDEYHTSEYINRVISVNSAYGYFYQKGILKEVAFEYEEYNGCVLFALDADELLPYRNELESAENSEFASAAREIFDEHYSPCLYSGAIELTGAMQTFREFAGTVECSWEIEPCQHMDSCQVLDVLEIKEKQGVREAVKYIFKLLRDNKI